MCASLAVQRAGDALRSLEHTSGQPPIGYVKPCSTGWRRWCSKPVVWTLLPAVVCWGSRRCRGASFVHFIPGQSLKPLRKSSSTLRACVGKISVSATKQTRCGGPRQMYDLGHRSPVRAAAGAAMPGKSASGTLVAPQCTINIARRRQHQITPHWLRGWQVHRHMRAGKCTRIYLSNQRMLSSVSLSVKAEAAQGHRKMLCLVFCTKCKNCCTEGVLAQSSNNLSHFLGQ